MKDFTNILVIVKSTKGCRKALHYGISSARCSQAKLHVLYLMHDPFGLEHWQLALPSLKAIGSEYQTMRAKANKELDTMIAAEQAKGLRIQVDIAEGAPEKEILSTVRNNNIDLLIMIAHTEGYLEQMLFDRLNEESTANFPARSCSSNRNRPP